MIVGSPTALGGHFGGHGAGARPSCAALGLRDRLAARPGLAGDDLARPWRCRQRSGLGRRSGPAGEEPRPICRLPGAARDACRRAAWPSGGDAARLLVLGGDCTTHAGAMAGIRRARPGIRLGLAWFDAHGDFNTPDTTPSGNVWGMPFAMACGRGDAGLVAAAEGPIGPDAGRGPVRRSGARRDGVADACGERGRAVRAGDAGAIRLGRRPRPGGRPACRARIDAWYIAFDMDALDASGDWAIAMPEPDGLMLGAAAAAVRAIATSGAPGRSGSGRQRSWSARVRT